jgi:HD-GYP domain
MISMLFVLTSKLKNGMALGESIKDAEGKMLLSKGQILRPSYIAKIQELSDSKIVYVKESPEDIKILNDVKYRLKNDLIGMISKYSFQELHIHRSVQRSPFTSSKNQSEEELIDEVIADEAVMGILIDLYELDNYTFRHSINTAAFSYIIGLSLDMGGQDLYNLLMGALLHDIGKTFIKLDVLNKSDKLTEKEYEEMKTHAHLGYNFLKEVYQKPEIQCIAALEHHERINGSGYPLGKKGEQISLTGRITGIADVYDALTSDRPFRRAMVASEAMEFIMGGAETLFDPDIARLFSRAVIPFPAGTMVRLSNGVMGVVEKNYQDCCTRPRIRAVEKSAGNQMMDLKNDPNLKSVTITELVMSV